MTGRKNLNAKLEDDQNRKKVIDWLDGKEERWLSSWSGSSMWSVSMKFDYLNISIDLFFYA